MQKNNTQNRIRINNFIRVPQVRVIDAEGVPLGVMNTSDAMKLAREQNLDLVEINPKTSPPVCKIIDFGKYKYEEKKKLSESRKNQKTSELKEISFRPNTDEGDLNHKLENAKQFLADGNKVKFTVKFRGREITHPKVGEDKLRWFLQELASLIAFHTPLSLEGKVMSVMINPKN